jgi:osmoprotectant transport system ATP-binding protein
VILVTHDIDEAFRLGDRVAVMSRGRLLQHARPALLITQPADPFVSQMIGSGDRSLKLLSLTTAGEVADPGSVTGPVVQWSVTLRDVLAELVWSGAAAVTVVGPDGAPIGHVTLASILARGRQAT